MKLVLFMMSSYLIMSCIFTPRSIQRGSVVPAFTYNIIFLQTNVKTAIFIFGTGKTPWLVASGLQAPAILWLH
jgi:hypothetical protein